MLFSEKFQHKYYDKLNLLKDRHRGEGFLKIFRFLEKRMRVNDFVSIIETGTMRPGYTLEGDGQATMLFDEFLNHANNRGSLVTVDIDPRATNHAEDNTSLKTTAVNSDSIKFLWDYSVDGAEGFVPDVFYLDSYDVDFHNPHPANMHHMKEMVCVMRMIGTSSPTLIAIDDCKFVAGDGRIAKGVPHYAVGKGYYVRQFMDNVGANLIHDDYQLIWEV
jgi:hypothetical protein